MNLELLVVFDFAVLYNIIKFNQLYMWFQVHVLSFPRLVRIQLDTSILIAHRSSNEANA